MGSEVRVHHRGTENAEGAQRKAAKGDPVRSPGYYRAGGYEVIDVICAFGLNFCRGAAVKYVIRAGRKSAATELQDLEKAVCVLEREIRRVKGTKR